ncbi:MAG: GNAT family N-acetyltransferase [Dehalococcoidia bacterium]
MHRFTIRRFSRADQTAIEALERSVGPYRAEDAAEVATMRARAAHARESGSDWRPHSPEPDSITDVDRWYAAFWVAESADGIIGMVGVRRSFHEGAAPPRHDWHEQDNIAELRRLRVAPEARREGVGTSLTRAVIDWCRSERCRVLYLHTTSPQAPARALYEGLGFRDIGHTLTGEYEYVWYALEF